MTLQHQRINVALAVADVAKSYCTGDIRRAVAVLCATVEQQQAFRFELNVAERRRFVVNDSRMVGVSGDGVERDVAEERLLGAQLVQLRTRSEFGLIALRHSHLQPLQKLHHSHAVALHSTAEALALRVILHRLHSRYGRRRREHGEVAARLRQCAVHRRRVDEHRRRVAVVERRNDIAVVVDGYAFSAQIVFHLRREFLLLYI